MLSWLSVVLIILLAGFADAKRQKRTSEPKPVVLPKHFQLCAGKPPLHKKDTEKLSWLLEASGDSTLTFTISPQHKAACWILYDDKKQSAGRSKYLFLQRYALATLHISSTKSNTTLWDWPVAADDPQALVTRGHWGSTKFHECKWYGVYCNFANKVVRLDLGFLKVDGLVPRELWVLTELRDIDLHANDLQGVLPNKMLESLHNLEAFRFHMNGFFGALPKDIVGMENLRDLVLFGNYLSGSIPTELAELHKLEVLDIYANNFKGRIPTHLGKLRKLQYLDLHDNDLTGSMPSEICKLPNLKVLVADCLAPRAEVQCDCCTVCCKGQMDGTYVRKCVDMKTGQEIQ
ncbi:hypothetical protein ACA910_000962 [Epithemia clementina (nom. ined.)]